jgi:hypothetical protein
LKYASLAHLKQVVSWFNQHVNQPVDEQGNPIGDPSFNEPSEKLKPSKFTAPTAAEITTLRDSLNNILSLSEDLKELNKEWKKIRKDLENLFDAERVLPENVVDAFKSEDPDDYDSDFKAKPQKYLIAQDARRLALNPISASGKDSQGRIAAKSKSQQNKWKAKLEAQGIKEMYKVEAGDL